MTLREHLNEAAYLTEVEKLRVLELLRPYRVYLDTLVGHVIILSGCRRERVCVPRLPGKLPDVNIELT